jgi:hypothetical protein
VHRSAPGISDVDLSRYRKRVIHLDMLMSRLVARIGSRLHRRAGL